MWDLLDRRGWNDRRRGKFLPVKRLHGPAWGPVRSTGTGISLFPILWLRWGNKLLLATHLLIIFDTSNTIECGGKLLVPSLLPWGKVRLHIPAATLDLVAGLLINGRRGDVPNFYTPSARARLPRRPLPHMTSCHFISVIKSPLHCPCY